MSASNFHSARLRPMTGFLVVATVLVALVPVWAVAAGASVSATPIAPDCSSGFGIFSRLPDPGDSASTVVPQYPEIWKIVTLERSGPGDEIHVELARSPEWIQLVGAAVGNDLYLEFPELGVIGPVPVTDIAPVPPLEPGQGALVTGIIERITADSTGLDTLCNLEAYRFQEETPEPDSVWAAIARLRHRGHISLHQGTVAYLRLAGMDFYGVNGSLDDDLWFVDDNRESAIRHAWHDRLEPTCPYGRSRARYLDHAEEHALMKAHRRLGYLPPDITLFVDRETCRWCREGLGSFMRALGLETLTIWQEGIAEPLRIDLRKPPESEPEASDAGRATRPKPGW